MFDELKQKKIIIRPMTIKDYNEVLYHWMVKEGWNPGKYDSEIYFAGKAKRKKYYVLELDGKMISAVAVYSYKSKPGSDYKFGFAGCYITDEQFKQKGYGRELWFHTAQQLGEDITIGAYSVPSRLEPNKKLGFNCAATFFDTHRWEGCPNGFTTSKNPAIDIATEKELDLLVKYDMSIFPADRASFLQALLRLPLTFFIISYSNRSSGKINGFAAIRPCHEGYRIGPMYADNIEIAKALMQELFCLRPKEQKLFFDTDSRNQLAVLLAQYFNFQYIPDARCVTIYKGTPPEEQEQNIEKKYAILSLDMG